MDTDSVGFESLDGLVRWLNAAPIGTTLDAREVARILGSVGVNTTFTNHSPDVAETGNVTWRERLWTVPAETRLGVVGLAEALGRPKSWVYARTSTKAEAPLPFRRLDGALVFVVGEIRTWVRSHEEVIHACEMESTPTERRLRAV